MRKSKYTIDLLLPIVKEKVSLAGVIRALGLKPTGGNHRSIKNRIRQLNIDISHFTGQRWNNGLTANDHPGIAAQMKKVSFPDNVVLSENAPHRIHPSRLRKLMIKNRIPYICKNNHLPEWMGNPLQLHIDHENGKSNDNRLENLRFLCPNCHQQTDTWGNKKRK